MPKPLSTGGNTDQYFLRAEEIKGNEFVDPVERAFGTDRINFILGLDEARPLRGGHANQTKARQARIATKKAVKEASNTRWGPQGGSWDCEPHGQ